MNSKPRLIPLCLLVVLILAGAAFLSRLVEGNLGMAWPSNVIRNWEEYGLVTLKGKLVQNPGGWQALEHPDVYPGHRPVTLYPVFAMRRLFAWTNSGSLPFHLALNFLILLSIWSLLGANRAAGLVAGTTVLCAGYSRWLILLDPNALAVILGLPFAVLLRRLLKQPHTSAAGLAALFLLISVYSLLNWTTVMVHGLLMITFLAARQLSLRKLIIYALLAGLSGAIVVAASVVQKIGGGRGGLAGVVEFLQFYAWGDKGYGAGMTFSKAVMRLGVVNFAGLLPLLALWAWSWFRAAPRNRWPALAPLGLAVVEVLSMRNYFGHHPWMAAPLLIVGIILSLHVLVAPQSPTASEVVPGLAEWGRNWSCVYLCAAFCFSTLVLVLFLSQAEAELALVSMVRHHTQRSDVIVVTPDFDPALAGDPKRFGELLDRRVLVLENSASLPEAGSRAYLLSASADYNNWPVFARTAASRVGSLPVLRRVMNWFNTSVARRNPGDRIEYAGAYFLYVRPDTRAPRLP